MENDSSTVGSRPDYDDEIDFRELFAALWSAKKTIVVIVVISGLISVQTALSLPDKYSSEASLAPRSGGGVGGALGQMASQFGGLASLAGVNLGGLGAQGSVGVAVAMLQSREFFKTYLYDAVLVDLMAAEGWDRATGEVVLNDSLFDKESKTWVREIGAPFQAKPSVQEAYRVFSEGVLTVTEDAKTSFVKVKVTHYSPVVARNWVTLIVNGVNEAVMARDGEEA